MKLNRVRNGRHQRFWQLFYPFSDIITLLPKRALLLFNFRGLGIVLWNAFTIAKLTWNYGVPRKVCIWGFKNLSWSSNFCLPRQIHTGTCCSSGRETLFWNACLWSQILNFLNSQSCSLTCWHYDIILMIVFETSLYCVTFWHKHSIQ